MTVENGCQSGILAEADLARLPSVAADHRIFYGPDAAQFGELYLPRQSVRRPLVIMIHGGCWRARYGLEHLGQLCSALRDDGNAVWNLEYRRLGNGGGWPATFNDVAAGADFLISIAGRFSLDLSSVISVGHSAGGHLALWLAGRHRLPETSPLYSAAPLPIRGVVSLAGISDLAEAVKAGICRAACLELLGGLPEEAPDRYRQVSPVELLPLGVSQWHLIGLQDQEIPVDYLRRYLARAGQLDEVHVEFLPDAGHYELIVPATPAWHAVRNAVRTLLGR